MTMDRAFILGFVFGLLVAVGMLGVLGVLLYAGVIEERRVEHLRAVDCMLQGTSL